MTQFQSLQNIEDLLMHYAIEGISGSALFWIFSSQAIELSLSTVICRGLMNKIVYMITEELRAAILPIIFFFAVFHLMAITKTLILEGVQNHSNRRFNEPIFLLRGPRSPRRSVIH
jgi:hypothetical protein